MALQELHSEQSLESILSKATHLNMTVPLASASQKRETRVRYMRSYRKGWSSSQRQAIYEKTKKRTTLAERRERGKERTAKCRAAKKSLLQQAAALPWCAIPPDHPHQLVSPPETIPGICEGHNPRAAPGCSGFSIYPNKQKEQKASCVGIVGQIPNPNQTLRKAKPLAGGRCGRKHLRKVKKDGSKSTDLLHYQKIVDCKYDKAGDRWIFHVKWNNGVSTWEPEDNFPINEFTAVRDETSGWKNLVRKSTLLTPPKSYGKKAQPSTVVRTVQEDRKVHGEIPHRTMQGIPSSTLYTHLRGIYALSQDPPNSPLERFLPIPVIPIVGNRPSPLMHRPTQEATNGTPDILGAQTLLSFLEYSLNLTAAKEPVRVVVAQCSSDKLHRNKWSLLAHNGKVEGKQTLPN